MTPELRNRAGAGYAPRMTTATAARTPKLKVFAIELRFADVPSPLAAAAEFPQFRSQGEVMVTAPSKRVAIDRLATLGFGAVRPGWLALAAGNRAYALIDAGWHDSDGDVTICRNHGVDTKVIVQVPGDQYATGARRVGHWTHDPLGSPVTRRRMFVRRDADGALFPERTVAVQPTPATGWVPTAEES